MKTFTRASLVVASAVAAFASTGCSQPVESNELAVEQQAQADSIDGQGIHITKEIDIQASADKIWSLLIDVNDYSTWNKWLIDAKDDDHANVQVGDHITATVILNGGTTKAPEQVSEVTPPGTAGQPAGQLANFCWNDAIPIASCITPAYRCRTLTQNADGSVHVKNDLVLQGAINWTVWLIEQQTLHSGMDAENTSLKAKAEQP